MEPLNMKQLLKIFLPLIVFASFSLYGQTIQGNWECNAAIVEYTYEVREFDSPEDSANGSYAVTASWPSSALAAAGYGYTHTLKEYAIGDTIAVALVPLINPTYLAMFGVAMNVDLNDNGTFTINDGSTYPTTETENCSTFATVPAVSEDGTWVGGSGYVHPDNPLKYSMGWGISLSSVFAQFSAADLVSGTYGTDYGVGSPMENWGMVTLDYADEAQTMPVGLEIFWEAHDGVASGLGVNDAGQLNGFTGVPLSPADTVSIHNIEAYLAYYHPDTSLWWNLGWTGGGTDEIGFPMLGGEGHPINPQDPNSFTIDPATGDTLAVGTVAANHGYLFDPAGADGEWFSGDEGLAPTGYFFTFNFLEASMTFSMVLDAMLGAGVELEAALNAAADSVAFIYLDADLSAAVASQVSSSIATDYLACVGAGLGDACNAYLEAGPTMSLIGVQQACNYDCGVDDSGWDWDTEVETGRLVMEVDNRCIPDNTTQRVRTFWAETSSADLDEDVPVADKFELLGNYPNPFNPETKIRFATEMDSHVKVTIYSILGQKIAVTYDGQLSAGTYNITWNGRDSRNNSVPSGVYYYKVESDDRFEQGKMLLLK